MSLSDLESETINQLSTHWMSGLIVAVIISITRKLWQLVIAISKHAIRNIKTKPATSRVILIQIVLDIIVLISCCWSLGAALLSSAPVSKLLVFTFCLLFLAIAHSYVQLDKHLDDYRKLKQ
jgi:hypothetical protein